MNIVCFGQQNWDVCWTGKQQLLTRLARAGHRVLYVDPTWADPPAESSPSLAPGLREGGCGALYIYTHPARGPLGWRHHEWQHRRQVRHLVRWLLPGTVVGLVLRPDVERLLDELSLDALVYYAVDEWTGFAGYSDEERAELRAGEERLLRRSDLALGVSPRLVERFRAIQPASHLLTNGADVRHFAPERIAAAPLHPELDRDGAPRIGFVGQVDDRLDVDLIEELVHRRPEWRFCFIGRQRPSEQLARLERLPRTQLLGYLPYEYLPSALRGVDVCIVPYRRSALTESCHPLKIMEYLATGKPVVTRPLAGLGPARDCVRVAETSAEFEAAIEAALRDPEQGRSDRLATAAKNSWPSRVRSLERHLRTALTRRAARRSPATGAACASLPDPGERLHEYGRRQLGGAPTLKQKLLFGAAKVAQTVLPRQRQPRVLFVRHGYLGDMCLLVPAVRELRRRRPDVHIALGLQPHVHAHPLFDGLVDEIDELSFLEEGPRRLRSWLEWVGRRYDAVVTGPSYMLREEAMLLGAPRRIGVFDAHPWQRLLTEAELLDRSLHEFQVNLRLVSMLLGEAVETDVPFRIEAPPHAGNAREELGLPPDERILVVHPGSAKPSRRWGAERFGAVAGGLLAEDPGLHLCVTGKRAERHLTRKVIEGVDPAHGSRVHDATARCNLGLLAAVFREASLLLSNDTGVMHLARGLGTPLCAVLGPDDHRRWGPAPRGDAPAIGIRHLVPCAPCARQDCSERYCLNSATEHEVLTAGRDILGGRVTGTRLELRLEESSWRRLHEDRFALPEVAVLALTPEQTEALIGACPHGRRPVPWNEFMRGLALQEYPRFAVFSSAPAPAEYPLWYNQNGRANGHRPRVHGVDIPAGSQVRCLRHFLESTEAELVALATPFRSWSAGTLGQHVASLVRAPEAQFSRASIAGPSGRRLPDPCSCVVRREYLVEAADRGLALREALRPERPHAHTEVQVARG